MFTKADYEGYFSVIQKSEKQMCDDLSEMIDNISDFEILKELIQIREDEVRHTTLVDNLFNLLGQA